MASSSPSHHSASCISSGSPSAIWAKGCNALRMISTVTEGPVMGTGRSEEHTSELQSLMRISYAVFCLKKKRTQNTKDKKTKNGNKKTEVYYTHSHTQIKNTAVQ